MGRMNLRRVFDFGDFDSMIEARTRKLYGRAGPVSGSEAFAAARKHWPMQGSGLECRVVVGFECPTITGTDILRSMGSAHEQTKLSNRILGEQKAWVTADLSRDGGMDPRYAEIQIFSQYAVRHLSNVDENYRLTLALALCEGMELFDKWYNRTEAAWLMGSNPLSVGPALIGDQRSKSRSFDGILRLSASDLRFRTTPRGWGPIGGGIMLYACLAVTTLYRAFTNARDDDADYRERLRVAAALCGVASTQHRGGMPRDTRVVALQIASLAMTDA